MRALQYNRAQSSLLYLLIQFFFNQTSMNAFLSATVCTSVKIQMVDTDVAVMISSKWTLQIPKTVYVSDF